MILDRNKLSVDPGANHPVADSRMDAVGKIDRAGSGRKTLDISGR